MDIQCRQGVPRACPALPLQLSGSGYHSATLRVCYSEVGLLMSLKSLLLCSDEKIVRVLRRVLGDLDIAVDLCRDADAALRKLTRQRFEAIIVDTTDDGASDVLRSARIAPCNKQAVAVAIVEPIIGLKAVFKIGAHFVLYKPVSSERAKSSFRAARALMKSERRRNTRVAVQIPVVMRNLDGGANMKVKMVAGGNEQFGVTGADQILIARSKGVPVVAVAVIYRRNPFVLFSLAKSGIKTPADYIGKKVGVKIGGNEELIYRAVLAKAKIDKSQLTEIPVKFDMTPLLTGDIDVWPGYLINEVLAAKEKGFDVNIVNPSDYGIDLYADTLFTTEAMLKEKPDVVRNFVAATLKGWNAAIAAPEEAAKITLKYGDKLTYEHELAMVKASVPLLKPDAKPVGYMDQAGWSSAQQLLLAAGFQKGPVDIAKAFVQPASQ